MSIFHVHARCFEGTLADPIRNETRTAESDDREHAMGLAEDFAARGYRTWVYEHDHRPDDPNGRWAPYRVIAELAGESPPRHAGGRV